MYKRQEDDTTATEINVDAETKIRQMTAIVTETDAKINHDLRHELGSMEEMKTESHLQANLVTEFLDKEE